MIDEILIIVIISLLIFSAIYCLIEYFKERKRTKEEDLNEGEDNGN